MTRSRALSAGLAAGLLWAGTAFAQAPPPSPTGQGAERVEGQVVKIDHNAGTVTLQTTSGQTYQFQASQETLMSLKVGDRIEARLRTK